MGCLEKNDLLKSLYDHYGIDSTDLESGKDTSHNPKTNPESRTSNSAEKQKDKNSIPTSEIPRKPSVSSKPLDSQHSFNMASPRSATTAAPTYAHHHIWSKYHI